MGSAACNCEAWKETKRRKLSAAARLATPQQKQNRSLSRRTGICWKLEFSLAITCACTAASSKFHVDGGDCVAPEELRAAAAARVGDNPALFDGEAGDVLPIADGGDLGDVVIDGCDNVAAGPRDMSSNPAKGAVA